MHLAQIMASHGSSLLTFHWPVALVVIVIGGLVGLAHHVLSNRGSDE